MHARASTVVCWGMLHTWPSPAYTDTLQEAISRDLVKSRTISCGFKHSPAVYLCFAVLCYGLTWANLGRALQRAEMDRHLAERAALAQQRQVHRVVDWGDFHCRLGPLEEAWVVRGVLLLSGVVRY